MKNRGALEILVAKQLVVLGYSVSLSSGVWGKTSEAFAIWTFTGTRIVNTYVIIPSAFAL